jgi:hypothetical protein
MMSNIEFQDHLAQLGLTQIEAAQLLSMSPRAVRRWGDGSQEIPGPAEQALRAWLRLHHRALAWKPNEVTVADDDEATIARHREHAMGLDNLLQKVKARGGPAAPWQVDLERCRATLGPLQVSFYKLCNGGFSPQSYRRADGPTDLQRDWPLIEDAYACIAQAFSSLGSPLRTRFAFIGPSLDKGRIALWDLSLTPPVVAVIPCQTIRNVLQSFREASDARCRLLALNNKDLLCEIAEMLFDKQRFEAKEFGIRVIEIQERDLQSIASRLHLPS